MDIIRRFYHCGGEMRHKDVQSWKVSQNPEAINAVNVLVKTNVSTVTADHKCFRAPDYVH